MLQRKSAPVKRPGAGDRRRSGRFPERCFTRFAYCDQENGHWVWVSWIVLRRGLRHETTARRETATRKITRSVRPADNTTTISDPHVETMWFPEFQADDVNVLKALGLRARPTY